jgi:hypothetical protein
VELAKEGRKGERAEHQQYLKTISVNGEERRMEEFIGPK